MFPVGYFRTGLKDGHRDRQSKVGCEPSVRIKLGVCLRMGVGVEEPL